MYQSQWAPQPHEVEEKASTSQTPFSLSAAAPTFSPAPPPPEVSSVDYFAQTGAAQDDLFDEITPIDSSMRVRSEDDLFSDDFTPVEQTVVEPPVPPQSRGRGVGDGPRVRGRGRGRGRGEFARGGAQSQSAHQQNDQTHVQQQQQQQKDPPPENAPSGPRKASTIVRGDRQATGGLRKPKLTEGELAEKMARIQIKNADLTAAHARAEADAASFAERETAAKQQASQRKKEERRDRQQMMGERERNRMRKLKATEGREWDAEKNEDDFARNDRHDRKGGFAGDKQGYTDGREYLYREPRGGQRGGPGAGRGGRAQAQGQSAPKQEEFPALPVASDPMRELRTSRGGEGGDSWADQVESSNPA